MIHTDEDDEFERIAHENQIKSGQPYFFDVYVSQSQRNFVIEEIAKEVEKFDAFGQDTISSFSIYIRGLKK